MFTHIIPGQPSTVFFVPRVEYSFLQRQLPCAECIFWNNLPFSIRFQLCKQTFKCELKNYLLSSYDWLINAFLF